MTERAAPRAASSPRPSPWRTALVKEVAHPLAHSVQLRLEVPDRVVHRPGQHYVVRLTAEDGYRASRSYSVASVPADPLVELWVQRLEDGEVSTYLADGVVPGDTLEVRGPIGGWFAWDGATPALAVGGGTGVVPLVCMLRHAIDLGRTDLLRVAAAARTASELPYAEELTMGAALVAYSRSPSGAGRRAGRLVEEDLVPLISPGATAYVCGSAGFAEHASQLLVDLGVPAAMIRVERFGPSG